MDAPALFNLIGEPTRHGILERLRQGDATVSQLIDATGREQSNVSHHLRTLRDAGIVKARAVGRERHYRLADPELRRLLDQVDVLLARLDTVTYYTGLELPVDTGFHGYG